MERADGELGCLFQAAWDVTAKTLLKDAQTRPFATDAET
jgi:hypothetical protein